MIYFRQLLDYVSSIYYCTRDRANDGQPFTGQLATQHSRPIDAYIYQMVQKQQGAQVKN